MESDRARARMAMRSQSDYHLRKDYTKYDWGEPREAVKWEMVAEMRRRYERDAGDG